MGEMERHVPEPTHTLEGWHVLHDFRLLDFARWFSAPLEAREDAWEELKGLVREWRGATASTPWWSWEARRSP